MTIDHGPAIVFGGSMSLRDEPCQSGLAPARATKEVAAHRPKAPPPLSKANAAERKTMPLLSGAIAYFPDALGWVSFVSFVGNMQHNPGQPMHWAQEKSKDHKDCCARHLAGLGTLDDDGIPHSWKLAWRALANLQMEAQAAGAPVPPGAKLPGQ